MRPGHKGLCAICGVMVLDNQLRAKVDDGKSYVHYGCYEAMQPAPGAEAHEPVRYAKIALHHP